MISFIKAYLFLHNIMLLQVRRVYNYIRMHKNDLKIQLTPSE